MKLTKARIRHYKSLDDVVIDFAEGITVLVGPNAVGKSNVVDGLRFVRDALASDLEHAVSSRGGIARVRQYSKTKPFKLSIQLQFAQQISASEQKQANYEFSVESKTASNYSVDHEAASYFDSPKPGESAQRLEMKRDRTGTIQGGRGEQPKIPADQLALGRFRSAWGMVAWPIERFIRDWRFASIYPNQLRTPSTPDKDSVLAEDGHNWASVIKALKRTARGRTALGRIFDAMQTVIPGFEEVSVNSVGSYLVPAFQFAIKGGDKVHFDPVQLSDGTLRVFGILLALYQVPAPQLLVIEEPEQTIHPGVLAVLADAFVEASEVTQIIVTTHSPHLVDRFGAEQLRVVSLEQGMTRVHPLKKTQVEAVKKRLMTLQEFMSAEGLLPEVS